VRTAIIPEEGQKLLISDFSAIEARVTAWFAGEEWRLQTFRDGGDIYCASASQMFHVPVVKHGVNGELRQKGKVAELALGYGGGVNALKAFGADKMGMSEEEMQETVDLWRESSPASVSCGARWRRRRSARSPGEQRRFPPSATSASTLSRVCCG
jgi:DNA polymerase